jgi:hypothetical protein
MLYRRIKEKGVKFEQKFQYALITIATFYLTSL